MAIRCRWRCSAAAEAGGSSGPLGATHLRAPLPPPSPPSHPPTLSRLHMPWLLASTLALPHRDLGFQNACHPLAGFSFGRLGIGTVPVNNLQNHAVALRKWRHAVNPSWRSCHWGTSRAGVQITPESKATHDRAVGARNILAALTALGACAAAAHPSWPLAGAAAGVLRSPVAGVQGSIDLCYVALLQI